MPAHAPPAGHSPGHVEKPSLRAEVGDTAYVSSTRLTGGLDEGEVLRGVDFDDCTFAGNVLVGAQLVGCTFTKCTFTGVGLSRADMTDSRFAECAFNESRLLGVNFAIGHTGTLSAPFRFERCRLDYASFRGLDVTGSVWRDCSFGRRGSTPRFAATPPPAPSSTAPSPKDSPAPRPAPSPATTATRATGSPNPWPGSSGSATGNAASPAARSASVSATSTTSSPGPTGPPAQRT